MFTRSQRWLLLAAFALLVAFRLPQAWVHGRFLDEEATVFLAYAWHHSLVDSMLRPFAGYLNLGATVPTALLAMLIRHAGLPLELAPYLTMTAALLAQLVPAALILTGRAAWLDARPAVVAALGIAVLAPATEEVFLNVLHIQFHLALACAAILALDVPRFRRAQIAYGTVLMLAPLCGPAAIMLVPLFALRAAIDRDPGRWRQCVPFVFGAAIQLLLFYGAAPVRAQGVSPVLVASAFTVRLIVLPLFNFGNADTLANAVEAQGGTLLWITAAIGVAVFGLMLAAAARVRDAGLWLALAGLGVAAATFGHGMVLPDPIRVTSPWAGERYQYLPLVLIGWALIALAMRGGRTRLIFAAPCLLMLMAGAARYPAPSPHLASGPSWPTEVAAWRRDHRHPLAVWPKPWTADLSGQTRPCSPLTGHLARSTDPRYCESGWVGSFFRNSEQVRKSGEGGEILH
ncbi:hypothetical protein [Sphingomonas bacterium]|uniref:hypothetical protein n=1 Tax=Sphingomonas bacterium TaxID=1895847 RepID=UPI001575A8B0|nr:hypothetical protein [Sphingomonas bacterium]